MEQYKIIKDKAFEDDVETTTSYIIHTLKNPSAALSLANEIRIAIEQRSKMPKAFKPYTILGNDKKKVYKIKVQNFYAFYYVDEKEKTMNFVAFIYARMNATNILDKIQKV